MRHVVTGGDTARGGRGMKAKPPATSLALPPRSSLWILFSPPPAPLPPIFKGCHETTASFMCRVSEERASSSPGGWLSKLLTCSLVHRPGTKPRASANGRILVSAVKFREQAGMGERERVCAFQAVDPAQVEALGPRTADRLTGKRW